MNKEKDPMDYTPLTREEIRVLTLERMRENKIQAAIQNEVLLEAAKREKGKEGHSSDKRTKLAVAIRNREAESVGLEDDVDVIESMLKKAKDELPTNSKD